MSIFEESVDFRAVLEKTRADGYAFIPRAATSEICAAMALEVAGLRMEAGDHVSYPINKGAANEVRQFHERAYRPAGHPDVPTGSAICRLLAELAEEAADAYPELVGWMPNEIGYQRYRDGRDWISPHRDRSSDRLLSVTFTIAGSAQVRVHEAETDPPDYARLRLIEEFLTGPGTVMFLRAPGFGSGRQIIHEVMPPTGGPRLILNLRMRPTILKPPTETRWR